MMPVEESHDAFLERLDASDPVRWLIAQWLVSRGNPVILYPVTQAATRDEWREHRDNGDLHVDMRVEVKGLTAKFTSKKDWPFKDFIVNRKETHDGAHPKPYAYLLVNDARTHVAIVYCSTQKLWTVCRKFNQVEQKMQDYYICPLDQVNFGSLLDLK